MSDRYYPRGTFDKPRYRGDKLALLIIAAGILGGVLAALIGSWL